MADEVKSAAADKPKIKLRFHKTYEYHPAAETDKDGNVKAQVKTYRAGDTDTFTQAEADRIRALGVAQTVINP